jgi:hypothetical protein
LNFAETRASNAHSMIARCFPSALIALSVLVLGACRKPQVETYRVPKETVAQTPPSPHGTPPMGGAGGAAGGPAMANTPVATATGAGLTWTAPAHWKPKPESPMRKGSFAIVGDGGEADLSITAFPGDVGGDLANLNRWRGQIELPPITESQFESATTHLDRNDLHMTVVDIVGTGANAKRILGAMIPHGGSTWFVKLMGPDALVAKEKAAFAAFLDTIKPAAAK